VRYAIFIIGMLIGFGFQTNAQTMNTSVNTRAKFKSIFMYKFAQYIEWPDAYKQVDFVIGVVGDDELANQLERDATTKNINSQSVVVKRFKSPGEVSKCNVIYISGNSATDVEPYFIKAKQYKCLIVTEGAGMLERFAAINFIVVGSQIKYEMNRKLFRDQDLVVSNSLENLATRVIN
jgi:hypothetical protein